MTRPWGAGTPGTLSMKHDLRGDVQTLRSELSEWDSDAEVWKQPLRVTHQQFRADGQVRETVDQVAESVSRTTYSYDDAGRLSEIQSRANDWSTRTIIEYDDRGRPVRMASPDAAEGGSTVWRYDADGRKTKVESVPAHDPGGSVVFPVEGAEQAYGAPGAATITTLFDEQDRPSEALFHDREGQLILRLALIWDEAGRLVSEESCMAGSLPFASDGQLEHVPEGVRAALDDAFRRLFLETAIMSRATYRYDSLGRRIERISSTLGMTEDRTLWEYADHQEPVREMHYISLRSVNIDSSGTHPSVEKSSQYECRFDYKFDAVGNWIERVVSMRSGAEAQVHNSNIERREIRYAPPR
ncbi:MAG TPA: hypothetical protein VFY29_06570 [Terriglobia bacterium]|nr:hypothetical protein [Terriglobia bacterium]